MGKVTIPSLNYNNITLKHRYLGVGKALEIKRACMPSSFVSQEEARQYIVQ